MYSIYKNKEINKTKQLEGLQIHKNVVIYNCNLRDKKLLCNSIKIQ